MKDIDEELVNYVVTQFKNDTGIDLTLDKMALQRVKDSAEKAKIELSSAMQTEINLPYVTADATGPKHLNCTITRAKFESLITELVERHVAICRTALNDSGLTLDNIDDVILVGGTTRIPAIQTAVETFFKKAPRKDVNPDEAVSAGAAIQAGVLMGGKTDILLLDVTPLSLGIETMGGVFTKLIDKNTTIPTKASQVFSTAEDNQSAVTIRVAQGERELFKYNHQLGEFNLDGIPPAQRGVPQIRVAFDLDANGILTVSAKDEGTGKEQKITIKSNSGLSDDEIARMIAEAAENAEADKAAKELIEARNRAESQLHIMNQDFEDHKSALTLEEVSAYENAVSELKAALDLSDKDQIEKSTNALFEASAPIIQAKSKAQSAEAPTTDFTEKPEEGTTSETTDSAESTDE